MDGDPTHTRTRRTVVVIAAAAVAVVAPVFDARTPRIADAFAQDRGTEAASRLGAGLRAASAGNAVLARREFLAAVASDPAAPDAWGELIRLDAADPERRALWVLDAACACADAHGKFTPPAKWPKVPRDEIVSAQKIASLRAAALKELLAAASKLTGASSTAALLRLERIARDLDASVGATAAARETAFAAARKKTAANPDAVTKALLQGAQTALAKDPALALRMARTARGILQQRGQSKTAAAAPDESLRAAATLVDRARESLFRDRTPPAGGSPPADGAPPPHRVWTLEDLADVPDEEIPAWNRDHGSWTSPAFATSPAGRYRIETPCGIQTLRATLRVVDAQHARIAAWTGKDPFDGRPGLVRLCPSDADFEAEGRPFWWAGGFQAGDVTVAVARFPSAPGIAGLLAHELTHRFDGALWPGLPRWAVEGRATYVATCAQPAVADTIDERLFSHGRLWEAAAKGYGEKKEFEGLLKGDVPDYRHLYDAGYSLWLFLERFRGFDETQVGPPVFRPRIRTWLDGHTGAAAKGDPVQRFVAAFADGKEGRPAGIDAFAGLFAKFIGEGGSGARPPAAWRAAWDAELQRAWQDASARDGTSFDPIFDAPVWSTARTRSDPPAAGEDLALEAAELLLLSGQKAPALEAAHWALQADEPRAATFVRVAAIDAECGDAAASWFAKAEAARLRPDLPPPAADAVPSAVAGAWRAVRTLADAYAEQAAAAEAAGRRRLAFALRADRDRIADLVLATPLGALPAAPESAAVAEPAREPETPAARSLLAGTLREVRWARRDTEPGAPWRLATADTIELGRSEAADSATSGAVRDAGAKRVAVESPVWAGGTYTVRTRVRFVSAYTDAALVIGRTTTDRGVEIALSGGDYEYAIGNRQGAYELRGVSIRLDDGRTWDGHTTTSWAGVPFEPPREVFDLEARVAGPYVRVSVNGEVVLSLRRATGAPVEGSVVFALERGIVSFEEPTLRTERVLGADRRSAAEAFDERLRLDAPVAFPWKSAPGRVVEGVPRSARGTLLLWYPEGTDADEFSRERVVPAIGQIVALATGSGAASPDVVVVVPEEAAEGTAAWLVASPDVAGPGGSVKTHRGSPAIRKAVDSLRSAASDGYAPFIDLPVWIAVDPDGVVRRTGPGPWPSEAAALFRSLAGR